MDPRPFAALKTVVYATIFLLLWGWIALGARALDPALGGPLPMWMAPVGSLFMAVGLGLALASAGAFVLGGKGGTPAPFDPPREFVRAGPYRWVRNPMYVGGFVLLAGFALLHGSPGMLLVAVGFLGFFHFFVVLYEEPRLERTFGDPYRRYRREVRRWIPRRPGAS